MMTTAKNTENTYSVLIFEGSESGGSGLATFLEQTDLVLSVVQVKRLGEGLVRLKQNPVDVVFIDLPELDEEALEIISSVYAMTQATAVIYVGQHKSPEVKIAACDAGAHDVILQTDMSPVLLGQLIRYQSEMQQLKLGVDTTSMNAENLDLTGIFHSLSNAILVLRKDYTIRFLNKFAASLLESEDDALVGEVFPFNLEGGGPGQLEIAGPHGTMRLFELEVRDFTWEGDQGLLVILRDITLVNQTAKDIAREEARLSILLESIKSGVIMTDEDGQVERMNSEAIRLTGLTMDRAKGNSLEDALWVKHPRTGRRVRNFEEVFLSREYLSEPPTDGVELTSRDGQSFLVRLSMKKTDEASPGHSSSILVVRDIMHEMGSELSRDEIEKLNAIGLLAGGIGHDFNNILSAVLGNLSLARLGLEKSHDASKHLLLAEKAALQARSLTQQLISFVKGGTPNLRATTLKSVVEDCSQFILRGSNVRCELKIPDDIWAVVVDVGQISQVLNNLIINADQAMPNGGILCIELENCVVTDSSRSDVLPGEYVQLTIRDEGMGISPDDIQRIFDPYFTTKQNGNGLGLASCASILKSHSGAIQVNSVVGEGSTFKVFVPRAMDDVDVTPAEDFDGEDQVTTTGTGRILIMDDMEAMMMVAGEIIKMLGYDVGFATNGREAIEAYKDAKEAGVPYDAVVFDLTVPGGMGGEEACKILLEYDPNLIAIASSGYTNSNVMDDFQSAGFKAVVPKPYRIKEMSDALSRVLKQAEA